MFESTVTSKGQTTDPAEIRHLIGARTGTRLVWHATPSGAVLVRAKTGSILDLAGMLKAPEGVHVAVEDMNPWR